MSKVWPKVIRDPVHNIVPFEGTGCDRLLLDLINASEFQRLRRIKQLGMSEMVFPGANHTRFAHCIGVMHIARQMLDRVSRLKHGISEDQRTAVLVAALLHDVGHGPFSHAFEKVTGQKHEVRTLEIIQSDKTEIGKRLRKYDRKLPNRLAVFFDKNIDTKSKKPAELPEFLTHIVSSQLDADRFDYLLRDSFATGTDYGRFDLQWIVLQLVFDNARGRLLIGRKGVDAAEAYVFARYHMYRSVYFHKASRAAEVMGRLALKRYVQLLHNAGSREKKLKIVPDAPRNVFAAFTTQNLSLDRYLTLDDVSLTEFFKACAKAKDKLLKSLGSGIVNRRFYKAFDVTDSDHARVEKFGNAAREVIRKAKLDAEFAFIDETAADTPYKPYNPDSERPESQIYVETSQGGPREISEKAKALKALRETYMLTRYYFPESVRNEIDRIARDVLKEENG